MFLTGGVGAACALWNPSATRLPDPAMAGVWSGEAQIVVDWTAQRSLPVRLVIGPDGRVSGRIGDARLVDGHLRPNRGWLGRRLRVKTDVIVVGRLEGMVIASEGVRRTEARLPLNWTGQDFRGGLHTGGAKFGGRAHAVLSASRLALRRAAVPGE